MKRIATITTALVFAWGLNAQINIEITDAGGIVQNESTYNYYGPETGLMELGLYAVWTGQDSAHVNVRRHELNVQAGTKNYFCWGLCYGSVDAGAFPSWDSDDPIYMVDGVQYSNFKAYHEPENQVGVSCYRYVWYLMSNPNDTTWVDICFDSETVGIDENDLVAELNVFPNPALGDVNFDIALDPIVNDAEIVVHNLLGERVWGRMIMKDQKRIVLNEGALDQGVYFYSIIADGRVALTEKLIIAN